MEDENRFDDDSDEGSIVELYSRSYLRESFISASEFDSDDSHSASLRLSPQRSPLESLDFEPSASVVAHERNTIQALKRISIDASSTSDPDLPAASILSHPSKSPPASSAASPFALEESIAQLDPALLWVPAHLHPELAPKEWRTFVQERVAEIQQRAPNESSAHSSTSSLMPPALDGGLVRRKSKLSREIQVSNGAAGFEDGSDTLDRAAKSRSTEVTVSDLEWLEDYAKQARASNAAVSLPGGGKVVSDGVSVSPLNQQRGLRRSTHTSRRSTKSSRPEPLTTVSEDMVRVDESSTKTSELSVPVRSAGSQVTVADGKLHLNFEESELGSLDIDPDILAESVWISAESAGDHPKSSRQPERPSSVFTSSQHSDMSNSSSRSSSPVPSQAPLRRQPHKTAESSISNDPNTRTDSLCIIPVLDTESSGPSHPGSPTLKQRGKALTAGFGRLFTSTKSPVKSNSFKLLTKSNEPELSGESVTGFQNAATKRETVLIERALPASINGKKEKESKLSSFFNTRKKGKAKLKDFGHRRSPSLSSIADPHSGKSQSQSPSPPSSPAQKPANASPYYYTRFPMHVERAIYRLSHLKLANPRRPLYQQVLLSNFMYGYLELINQDSMYIQTQQLRYQRYQQQQAYRYQLYQQEQMQAQIHQQQRQAAMAFQREHGAVHIAEEENMFNGMESPSRSSSRTAATTLLDNASDDSDSSYWHDSGNDDDVYETYFDPTADDYIIYDGDDIVRHTPRQAQTYIPKETYYESIDRQQREQEWRAQQEEQLRQTQLDQTLANGFHVHRESDPYQAVNGYRARTPVA